MGKSFHADAGRTGLLVVDVQERLASVMPDKVMERVSQQVGILIQGAKELGLPIVVTEQYRKGIGPTLETVRSHFPDGLEPLEKMTFSCLQDIAITEAIQQTGRDQWILCGMETHICVFQTARDLCAQGMDIFVPEDAVISRAKTNWRIGLGMMEAAGAVRTSVESVLFDLLVKAGTPSFRVISKLIK